MKQTSINIIPFLISIIFFTASCNNQSDKSSATEPQIESIANTSMTGVEVMEFRNGLISKSQGSYTDEQYEKKHQRIRIR